MGIRFRKRIRIFPGLYLNIGLRGISFSLGGHGATLSLSGKRGSSTTVGIPGSGVSYTQKINKKQYNKTKY
jgi:hypothetical protein